MPAGVAADGIGDGATVGASGGGSPPTTDPGPRCPHTAKVNDNTMKAAARPVVILVSNVAPARAPNAAWLLPPPNALAISPPLPCCSRMTTISSRHTNTYAETSR